jgi:hypothetical protein
MNRAVWVTIGMTLTVGIAWAVLGRGTEVLLGVVAPAGSTAVSWLSITRAWATAPEQSLSVMVRGFAVKCLLFVAWVTIMLKGFEVRAEPFVVSLIVSFLVLHAVEAWSLKRLMQT